MPQDQIDNIADSSMSKKEAETLRRSTTITLLITAVILSSMFPWTAAVPSFDQGISYSKDHMVTAPGSLSGGAMPKLALTGDILHVVWLHGDQVMLSRSQDDGMTWPTGSQLDDGILESTRWVDSDADDVSLYVTWVDTELHILKMANDVTVDLSPTPSITTARTPVIEADGDEVIIAWRDTKGGILAMGSTNGGLNFTAPVGVSNSSLVGYCQLPDIAIGMGIGIAWQGTRSTAQGLSQSDEGIFFSRGEFVNGSLSFSDNLLIDGDTEGRSDQAHPALTGKSGGFVAAWTDWNRSAHKRLVETSPSDITSVFLDDSGHPVSDPIVINDNSEPAPMDHVRLTSDNGLGGPVYFVWEDHRSGGSAIYSTFTSGSGDEISQNRMVHNRTSKGVRCSPDLALSGGRIYVTWEDHVNSNIMIAVSEIENTIPPEPRVTHIDTEYDRISIKWADMSLQIKDFVRYEVYMDRKEGFTPATSNLKWWGSGTSVTFTDVPLPPWNFSVERNTTYFVRLAILDEFGDRSFSDELVLDVPDHNFPPVFVPSMGSMEDIQDVKIDEDGHHTIELSRYFEDDGFAGVPLRFQLHSPGDGTIPQYPYLNASIHGDLLTVAPLPNWNGIRQLQVLAIDGGLDGTAGNADDLSASSNIFTVTVSPVDDPTEILHIYSVADSLYLNPHRPRLSIEELTEHKVQVLVRDPDITDLITIGPYSSGTPDMDIDVSLARFNTPAEGYDYDPGELWLFQVTFKPGNLGGTDAEQTFTLRIDDGSGNEVGYLDIGFALDFLEVNDPPTIVQVDNRPWEDGEIVEVICKEDETVSLTLTAQDQEGDDMTFFLEGLIDEMADRLSIDPGTGRITFTPNQDDVDRGSFTIRAVATDGMLFSVPISVRFDIYDQDEVPLSPTWEIKIGTGEMMELDNASAYTGWEVTVRPYGIDPDGDRVNILIDWGDGSSDETISGVSRTHIYHQEGNYTITLTSSDRTGLRSPSRNITLFIFDDMTDSDGDGYPDQVELHYGLDPSDPDSIPTPSMTGFGPSHIDRPEATDGPITWSDRLMDAGTSGPFMLLAAVALLSLLITGTEMGIYTIFGIVGGTQKRRKRLDNRTRGLILGYIVANPGDHYSSIQRALDLPNGTLAYQLHVLERDEEIRSKNVGRLKRFYPYKMKVPVSEFDHLTRNQQRVLKAIRARPGSGQSSIVKKTRIKQPNVSSCLKVLVEKGMIEKMKEKKALHYFPVSAEDRFRRNLCPICGTGFETNVPPRYCLSCGQPMPRYKKADWRRAEVIFPDELEEDG